MERVVDTSFCGGLQGYEPCTVRGLFDIYGFGAPKASEEVLRNIFGEFKEDE